MNILFGQFDRYFQVFIVLIVLDYFSGLIAAFDKKELNSSIGYRGILKKIGILVCIAVARQIDSLEWHDSMIAVRSIVLMFFIINEVLSILENLGKIGIPIPPVFKTILEKHRETEEKNEEK